jgi:deferrochelatase/peroxidase EfeB
VTDAPLPHAPASRAVLGGLVAGPLAATALAGCMFRSDPVAGASHPALVAPREEAVLALLAVPADPAKARGVVQALARRTRAVNAAGAGTSATLAVGDTWFAKAGLADRRPPGAEPLPRFPGDELDRLRTGGDVLVLVEGDNRPIAGRGSASMLAGLEGYGAVVRWQVAASRPENEVRDGRALTRDTLGFVQGFANRDVRDGPAVDGVTLIRSGDGVPAWAVGGTYLALRVLRLDRAAWDAEPAAMQEQVIGRRTDGRWLDGTAADGEPDFGADPYGAYTPHDSHVRLANPRTPGSSPPPLVRRSWSYATPGPAASREEGVLFMAYQADVEAGFVAVQRRLEDQALNEYVRAVGGGCFVVPPGDVRDVPWEQALLGG